MAPAQGCASNHVLYCGGFGILRLYYFGMFQNGAHKEWFSKVFKADWTRKYEGTLQAALPKAMPKLDILTIIWDGEEPKGVQVPPHVFELWCKHEKFGRELHDFMDKHVDIYGPQDQ